MHAGPFLLNKKSVKTLLVTSLILHCKLQTTDIKKHTVEIQYKRKKKKK